MRERAVVFRGGALPFLLVAPQIAVTLVFFIWPASQALRQSLFLEDPFGLSAEFVGLENFALLLEDDAYFHSIKITFGFSFAVTALSMSCALVLAFLADQVARGRGAYETLLIWPYAVAPAVAGVLWWFMFNPTIGIAAHWMRLAGRDWNHFLNGGDAMTLVILAAAWKQVSYNFLFFLAGMRAVPRSLIEAAAIDGSGPFRRFRDIVLPLLGPTTFFLAVVNLVYAFFDTFGVIHATTDGGPAGATAILVFKVFNDGFIGQDFGASAAQSVVLMAIVIALTVAQFRYVERRVHY